MRILINNDDGVKSPGIIALAQALSGMGEIYIAAPDSQRSAAANSLTLLEPIRVSECKNFPVKVKKAWAITGTPADCAKIALSTLLDEAPDVLISGINHGANMCVDIFYSGTVGAAYEGAFKNILSLAVSLDSFLPDSDFSQASKWGKFCLERLFASDAPRDRVYNINVPAIPENEIKGLKITHAGKLNYAESYERRLDPHGRPYYWLCGSPQTEDTAHDSDVIALRDGFVSLTPLMPDLSDYAQKEKLKAFFV